MAFRTDGLSKAYAKAQVEAIRVKAYAGTAQAALAAGNVSANYILQTLWTMKDVIALWAATAALPGMAQYARDQENDQGYDVVAEFQAMRDEAIVVRDWVLNNFPTSSPGDYLQHLTFNPDGSVNTRTFTPAQTVGLQTALAALEATIG